MTIEESRDETTNRFRDILRKISGARAAAGARGRAVAEATKSDRQAVELIITLKWNSHANDSYCFFSISIRRLAANLFSYSGNFIGIRHYLQAISAEVFCLRHGPLHSRRREGAEVGATEKWK